MLYNKKDLVQIASFEYNDKKEREFEAKKQKVIEYMETETFKNEEKDINKLAQEYYDYFEKHGKYPDEVNNNNSSLQPMFYYNVTATQGVSAMQTLGYSVNSGMMATCLAALGSLLGLGGPMTMGVFIAIVIGVAILYYKYNSQIKSTIQTYISTSCATTFVTNIEVAYTLAQQNTKQGYRYFRAYTTNAGGLGGVTVGTPFITLLDAVNYLKFNSQYNNVFSYLQSDANAVATGASLISAPVHHYAHNATNQPLNKPHYHATAFWVQMHGHSWY